MKKFFTASQIAHPPRRIQGKWERAMKRPKANFNQTIETKLSFSTASDIIIATPERFSFMKNIAIVILLMGAIALGTFCLHQQKQIAQTRAQLATSQKQLKERAEADEQTTFAERKSKALQEVLVKTSAFADEKSKQAEQLQQSLAAAKTNNPMQGFAAMFKDPKMKELIKSQQKAFMGPMLDKQYAALFQQLNLTPDQTAQLKDLLQNKMLASADAGMSLLDGSADATQRVELAKQIKSQTDDYDAQIKQFLGDDNYQTFQAYEKTTPDRMTISQFSDQLSGNTTPLSPEQQQQLMQAMSEERNGFKWTTDYNNKNPANGDFASMFTDDKISQFAQEKERLDQQILARARQILTPEQITAFEQFQIAQSKMQMAGMKMAAQMFAPKSP
jgi:hypothetical protein